MSRYLSFIMLWLFVVTRFNGAVAQPTPVLTCVSVISDTEIEVSWELPSDPFDGFRLFYGLHGGPYSHYIPDLPASTTSIRITGLDATTNIYEFYLYTFNNSPYSLSTESNHLLSIQLSISGDGTGIAELNFHGGLNSEYRILRGIDPSSLTLIGTSTTMEYFDNISNYCDPTLLYYVIEQGVCGTRSNVVSATLEDFTGPDIPKLTLVTIENGMAEVHWELSPSTDVDSYVIERKIGGIWVDYKIIGNSNIFIDNFTSDPEYIDPCTESITYIVKARDVCDLESLGEIYYLNPPNTILLTGNTADNCNRKASLQWNAYNNMKPPVTHYKVERSIGGSPFKGIAKLAATSSHDYQFTDPEMLESGVEVKYRISAVNGDNSLVSHSCELLLIPVPLQTTTFEISYVTVTNNTFITMNVLAEPASLPEQLQIYRSIGGVPLYLTTLPWDDSGMLTFEDHETSVGTTSYRYKVKALDACAFPMDSSEVFNSLLLTIGVDDQENVALFWNNHIGWGTDLLNYQVYKYYDEILIAGYPKTVSPNLTDYDEVVNPDEGLNTTYVVEAVHLDGRVSRSNEVLLPRTATVDVPTAFRPSGVNHEFRPLARYIDQNSYLFMVYNRWGQLVFETSDPFKGWDGRVNGDIQQGIYVYQVSYRDQAGVDAYKRGSVILLD